VPTSLQQTRAAAARAAIQRVVDERIARHATIPPEEVRAAAAMLLAGLWEVAAEHGVTADQWGWTNHLPRAALDTMSAAAKHRPARKRWQRA
jgi:hypothetical protein